MRATHLPAEKITITPGFGGADFLVPSGNTLLAFQYGTGFPDKKKPWNMAIVDLTTGKSDGPAPLPAGLTAKAISPDGSLAALSVETFFADNASEVDLMDLRDKTAKPKLAFIPYEGEDKSVRWVGWARFLDNNHLLTTNEGRGADSKLVLWDLTGDTIKGVWAMKIGHHFGPGPFLTSDSKYLVVNDTTGTYFLEAGTGKVAGAMCDSTSSSWFVNSGLQLVVRPDGKMLARSTDKRITVISLTGQPKTVADISIPPKLKVSNVVWAGDNCLLINRSYLIDIDKGMIIWKYTGLGGEGRGDGSLFSADSRVWRIARDDGKLSVTAFSIPDDGVKKTIAGLDLDKVMAIKPGLKVSLDIDIADEELAQSVRSHFEDELKKNDMTLADDQPITLRVKMGVFENKEVAFRNIHRPHFTPRPM